jgi:hypothetical protein
MAPDDDRDPNLGTTAEQHAVQVAWLIISHAELARTTITIRGRYTIGATIGSSLACMPWLN